MSFFVYPSLMKLCKTTFEKYILNYSGSKCKLTKLFENLEISV